MTEPSLQELERDAAVIRARLAGNLATLRSPAAQDQFTNAIKREAFQAKDDAIARARSAAEDQVNGWVDTIKARAADNPAAVLAIAAGVGWRIFRNPPIATALVGVGLWSLFRSGS